MDQPVILRACVADFLSKNEMFDLRGQLSEVEMVHEIYEELVRRLIPDLSDEAIRQAFACLFHPTSEGEESLGHFATALDA